MIKVFPLFLFLLLFSDSFCQELKAKKLRDLSPDRPHQTESSIATDKGRFMLEADLVNYRKETSGGLTTNALGIFFFNAKYGFHKNRCIYTLAFFSDYSSG